MKIQRRRLLFVFLTSVVVILLIVGCGSGGARTIGEMQADSIATATAAAVAADEAAQQARTKLPAYCADAPDRCVTVTNDPAAPVTIYEISDYGCPHCKNFDEKIYPQLKSEFVDTGKLTFVKIPASVLGDQPTVSPEAVLCANQQGAGEAYHSGIFAIQSHGDSHSKDEYMQIAEGLNLDMDAFEQCLDDDTFRSKALANRNLVRELGVNSTPSFFINGELIRGADYQGIVDAINRNLSQ